MEASIFVEPPARAILRNRKITQRSLAEFANQLRRRVAGGRSFHCRLTSDTELQLLNRKFLRHNFPTDVLSFSSASSPDGSLGDLAISVDRALAQAHEFGHSLQQELRVLILHGVLHLIGFDHETDDGGAMARTERRWRKTFKLPGGLIERVQ